MSWDACYDILSICVYIDLTLACVLIYRQALAGLEPVDLTVVHLGLKCVQSRPAVYSYLPLTVTFSGNTGNRSYTH